eukprot:m51a1_g3281 putative ccr4-not transcription complex subunit 7 (330) ;mRNA; f:255833-257414
MWQKKSSTSKVDRNLRAPDLSGMGSEKTRFDESCIKEVWASNLAEEMQVIRELVDKYPYVAMDTEFPGVVVRPVGTFKSTEEYHFQTLRCNVDLLKIIQLGVTFADEKGNLPPGVSTWQFNFKFNLKADMYAMDSIELLTRSGIDFNKHQSLGIDVATFGELLTSSGLVLNPSIKWISFHSGYDFGYLVKVLTCQALPFEEADFYELVQTYFPCFYDIKYLMAMSRNMKGGLQDLAEHLEVERIGPQHQAGSDALLTCILFFKMRKVFFEDRIDDSRFVGVFYGLSGPSSTPNSSSQPFVVQQDPSAAHHLVYFNSAHPPVLSDSGSGL